MFNARTCAITQLQKENIDESDLPCAKVLSDPSFGSVGSVEEAQCLRGTIFPFNVHRKLKQSINNDVLHLQVHQACQGGPVETDCPVQREYLVEMEDPALQESEVIRESQEKPVR